MALWKQHTHDTVLHSVIITLLVSATEIKSVNSFKEDKSDCKTQLLQSPHKDKAFNMDGGSLEKPENGDNKQTTTSRYNEQRVSFNNDAEESFISCLWKYGMERWTELSEPETQRQLMSVAVGAIALACLQKFGQGLATILWQIFVTLPLTILLMLWQGLKMLVEIIEKVEKDEQLQHIVLDTLTSLKEITKKKFNKTCPVPDLGEGGEWKTWSLNFNNAKQGMMPPDFAAVFDKTPRDDSITLNEKNYRRCYQDWHLTEFDDIFSFNTSTESPGSNNESPGLVLLEADSGCGKTILCQLQAYKWMERAESLDKDGYFLFLPLRGIASLQSLNDIVRNMYENPKIDVNDLMENYHGCIVFDGLDEVSLDKDSAILKLCHVQSMLSNKRNPNLRVIVTSRMYQSKTEIFQNWPDAKVHLRGAKPGAYEIFVKYFFELHRRSGFISEALDRCKEFNVMYKMLHIPIYVVLLCLLFDDEIITKHELTFEMPQTYTALFAAFIKVMVQRYQKRQRPGDQVLYDFNKSPLEQGSQIPNADKMLLFFVGKLCFEALQQNKYVFSEDEFTKSLVDINKIRALGVFTESNSVYEIPQKMFAEYFAGIYLAHTQLGIHLIQTDKFMDGKYDCIADSFRDKYNIVRFACGMSSDCFDAALERAKNCRFNFKFPFLLSVKDIEFFKEVSGRPRGIASYLLTCPFAKGDVFLDETCSSTGVPEQLTALLKQCTVQDISEILKRFFQVAAEAPEALLNCTLSKLSDENMIIQCNFPNLIFKSEIFTLYELNSYFDGCYESTFKLEDTLFFQSISRWLDKNSNYKDVSIQYAERNYLKCFFK